MKILLTIGTGVAGLGLLAAVTGAGNATPRRSFAPQRVQRTVATSTYRTHIARPRAVATACAGTGTGSFVGPNTGSDSAAGAYSAVLGGIGNDACEYYDAVGGGENNVASGNGPGAGSAFVGGGLENTVSGNFGSILGGEQSSVSGNNASIAGGKGNIASGNGAFIGAGGYNHGNTASGENSLVGAGDNNVSSGVDAPIVGGTQNQNQGYTSFDGGGYSNTVGPNSSYAFIGSGIDNAVSGSGSFIGAGGFEAFAQSGLGYPNMISGIDSFIGAGDQNTIAANEAFVGSGSANTISSAATYGSLIGGRSNTVSAVYATVIGGYGNTASGQYAIVAGGNADTAAGILTYAAGYHADAAHNGSFVWSDYVSGSATLKDTGTNQFVVRASGGTSIYSNEAATAGVHLAPGSGSWSSLSDRNSKTGIVPLDDASILAKVAALPVSAWQYTSETGVRHVGPMAQDFYKAFGVGEDDRHIATIDEDGVALAAIKALHRENADLRAELHRLEAIVASGRHR